MPVSEVDDLYINIVIYGENRVGKTTLACQFPKPLLLVSMEPNESSATGGAASVKNVEGVYHKRIMTIDQLDTLVAALEQGGLRSSKWPGTLVTVVADSVTSLQDLVMKKMMPNAPEILNWGAVSRGIYMARSEETRRRLRRLLNLPCHTVCIAKQKDHAKYKDPNQKPSRMLQTSLRQDMFDLPEQFFGADLGEGTAGWLHDNCDFICQYFIAREKIAVKSKTPAGEKVKFVDGPNTIRLLRTIYKDPRFAAGFRGSNPEAIPEFIRDPTFDKIQAVINGEMLEDAIYQQREEQSNTAV